ncbi:MAG: DMT family transporter [Nitrospirae bacterium]|nr:DMT family transporter [Nitrospirota bacterium]
MDGLRPAFSGRSERSGVVLALISAALWGVFPVVVNRGTQRIPPLTFAALSTLVAAAGALTYAALGRKLHELKKKEAYASLLMITLCIVIIPYVLFFIGSSRTSGVNTASLLLSEIIFTLVFTHFIGEKTTREKLVGALGVFLGALLILYNGSFQLNRGDVMIIASTATYPIGNFYAKRALARVSPPTILFVRFFLGGLFMLSIAVPAETQSHLSAVLYRDWPTLLLTGLLLLGVGKIVWYEALGRLDISKAISLGMTFPLFSLILLIGVFDETPSRYQWAGIAVMMAGVFFSVRRPSVDPALTRYVPRP